MPATALALSLVIQKYQKLTSTSIQNGGCGASFWVVQGFIFDLFWVSGRFWLPSASWEVFWVALRWVLVASWGRLGAVLGPKMDPVTPKFPPKPNPIGVLGRLEGSLERPRSVLGASWCVLKQLPASHTKKDEKLIQFWCPGT